MYRMLFYVNIYESYKLLKTVRFLAHPVQRDLYKEMSWRTESTGQDQKYKQLWTSFELAVHLHICSLLTLIQHLSLLLCNHQMWREKPGLCCHCSRSRNLWVVRAFNVVIRCTEWNAGNSKCVCESCHLYRRTVPATWAVSFPMKRQQYWTCSQWYHHGTYTMHSNDWCWMGWDGSNNSFSTIN